MYKKWICHKTDLAKAQEISKKFNISMLVSKILVNRGIIEEDEINVFLSPKRNDLHNPFLLQDIEIAVNKIIEAIDEKNKITIYGDYDVDGITSIVVLKRFLKDIGIEADTYMPNRLEEGYGLNKKALERIVSLGCDILITVDCGISAIEEVKYAKELGLEVIITDHHETLDELPKDAISVINPKRKDNKYPFTQLAGVGVVFKLIQAISKKLELEDKTFLKYLDLVCLGTIADIVPLVNENRVITKLGLKLLEVTKNPGLRALIQVSDFKKIDSITVSFGLAPRINACGRMGFEQEALKLFLTDSYDEAMTIAMELNKYNRERQSIERRIYEDVVEIIETDKLDKEDVIIIGKENWHHGVIGIVASKISEIYFKPTVLICFEGEKGKGSGRSIPGFDLHSALCECGEYLEKYGGHEMAIGLSLNKNNFDNFKEKFRHIAHDNNVSAILPVVNVDEYINAEDISIDNINQIQLLQPFGDANPMPLYVYRNLKVDSIRTLSEERHIKLTVKDGNNIFDAIGFGLGKRAEEINLGDKIDILMNLDVNYYNGTSKVQLMIKDIIKSYM